MAEVEKEGREGGNRMEVVEGEKMDLRPIYSQKSGCSGRALDGCICANFCQARPRPAELARHTSVE